MIKIIKNTMVDPIEKECPHCMSVFSFNYEDIHRETRSTLLGFSTETYRYLVCPVCKSEISMNRVEVNEEVNILKERLEVQE